MAQLTVKINGYAYTVGCADGQEAHLQAMAEQVESRVDRIRALGSQSGESRLLVQAALLMADELHDMTLEMAALRRAKPVTTDDAALDQRLSLLADRAEEIAATLERH
jgi:cell division protein ZapA